MRHMVGRCRPVGLVLCLVSLGQTHMLACVTWLGIGAGMVRRTCRHGQAYVETQLGIGADTVRLACAIW